VSPPINWLKVLAGMSIGLGFFAVLKLVTLRFLP
jgi:hypothetical protein